MQTSMNVKMLKYHYKDFQTNYMNKNNNSTETWRADNPTSRQVLDNSAIKDDSFQIQIFNMS